MDLRLRLGSRWEMGTRLTVAHDQDRRRRVDDALIRGHRLAVEALRSGPGSAPVGLTLSMSDYQALAGGEARADRLRHQSEDVYLQATGGDDFVGVQTYTRIRVGPDGMLGPEPGVPVTQMGYELWPEAVEATVRRAAAATGLPVLVTETGVGTADDRDRIAYFSRALRGVRRCLDDGIDVGGFVAWSLLDNFEWTLGYQPTFGLVTVDRRTFERRPKPSARWLGELARRRSADIPD